MYRCSFAIPWVSVQSQRTVLWAIAFYDRLELIFSRQKLFGNSSYPCKFVSLSFTTFWLMMFVFVRSRNLMFRHRNRKNKYQISNKNWGRFDRIRPLKAVPSMKGKIFFKTKGIYHKKKWDTFYIFVYGSISSERNSRMSWLAGQMKFVVLI